MSRMALSVSAPSRFLAALLLAQCALAKPCSYTCERRASCTGATLFLTAAELEAKFQPPSGAS